VKAAVLTVSDVSRAAARPDVERSMSSSTARADGYEVERRVGRTISILIAAAIAELGAAPPASF